MAANVMESSNFLIFAKDDKKSETCKLIRNVIPRFGKTPSVAQTYPCLTLVNQCRVSNGYVHTLLKMALLSAWKKVSLAHHPAGGPMRPPFCISCSSRRGKKLRLETNSQIFKDAEPKKASKR
jgi:hypothetical protein